jgi:hypothetical protein
MSSVTRFLRQIPVSTTYYEAATILNSGTVNANLVYEFVPTSSNYVGNYPAGFNSVSGGYVQTASPALQAAINQAYNSIVTVGGGALVLRDMGKTIFAPTTNSSTASWGYFRQVQLIAPSLMGQPPAFMGGLTGSTFGVLGAANTPNAYTDYLTFYIPVTVAGVGAGVNTGAYAIAGGQM